MRTLNKIMCIYPPTGSFNREDRCQDRTGDVVTVAIRAPMPLLYEAAICKRAGKQVFVRDYSVQGGTWNTLRRDVAQYNPDLVVFNITTPSYKDDMAAAAVIKSIDPEIMVAARGAYLDLCHSEALAKYPGLDIAIRNNWEETFAELVKGKAFCEIQGISYRNSAGLHVNQDRAPVANLDSIPFPDRSVFDHRLCFRPDTRQPEATIIVSRGCPFNCIYCLAPLVHGPQISLRTPRNIVDEMQECCEKFGIKTFLFRSDLFTRDAAWVKALCAEIIARKLGVTWACNTRVDTIDTDKAIAMKKAGCWAVAMGVESGNEESLKKMRKGITLRQAEEAVRVCAQQGLKVFTYFLIGFPWETRRHIEDSIEFAIKLNADLTQFSPVYPYPGTPLYAMALSEGLLKEEDLHPYALVKPVMGTSFVSKETVEDYVQAAWKRFHLRPQFITRTLLRTRNPREAWNYVRFGCRALLKLHRLSGHKKKGKTPT